MKNRERLIGQLEELLTQSREFNRMTSFDPVFIAWSNKLERVLERAFGRESTEFRQAKELDFSFHPLMWSPGDDFTAENREFFDRDLKTTQALLADYIEDLSDRQSVSGSVNDNENQESKIFVSHSSEDKEFADFCVDMLEAMGLREDGIFCTSTPGYDVRLGDDFLRSIQDNISKNTTVLFLLSANFYASPMCLCEMGATWILAKRCVPILIPPFDYNDIKGAIPTKQGMRFNEANKWSMLKDQLCEFMAIENSPSATVWERRRDRILRAVSDSTEK